MSFYVYNQSIETWPHMKRLKQVQSSYILEYKHICVF